MPVSPYYGTERKDGLARHEIFYGSLYRQKSIEYGLYVFLEPRYHNMSNEGVHFNKRFDNWLKQEGQKAAMDYYGWTIEDFRRIFGKNYL